MAVSKAHIKATNKWMAKAYDRINLTLPKGQKEVVQAHAAALGESTNAFIGRAIVNQMERDGTDGQQKAVGSPMAAPTEAGVVLSLSPATLKTAQEAAGAEGEGVPVFITRAIETQAQRDALSRQLSSKVKEGKPNA